MKYPKAARTECEAGVPTQCRYFVFSSVTAGSEGGRMEDELR